METGSDQRAVHWVGGSLAIHTRKYSNDRSCAWVQGLALCVGWPTHKSCGFLDAFCCLLLSPEQNKTNATTNTAKKISLPTGLAAGGESRFLPKEPVKTVFIRMHLAKQLLFPMRIKRLRTNDSRAHSMPLFKCVHAMYEYIHIWWMYVYVHINNLCLYCVNKWCVVACLCVHMHAVCILVMCILVYKCVDVGGTHVFLPPLEPA